MEPLSRRGGHIVNSESSCGHHGEDDVHYLKTEMDKRKSRVSAEEEGEGGGKDSANLFYTKCLNSGAVYRDEADWEEPGFCSFVLESVVIQMRLFRRINCEPTFKLNRHCLLTIWLPSLLNSTRQWGLRLFFF